MTRTFAFAALLVLAGAMGVHAADKPAPGAAALNTMYEEFWEENLRLNPMTATYAGDPRYNDQLENFLSQQYRDQDRAFHQKYLDRAHAIGTKGLTGQDRLSYDIFTLNRESALEAFEFPE